MLLGMGATTLSFFPTRNAVVAEGISEMMLLAMLIREAKEVDTLGFQIVPGLSEASNMQLPLLGRNGEEVAYIVDNDKGGKDLEKALKKAGFPEDRIKKISNGRKVITLEDCISLPVWKKAVNRYISMRMSDKNVNIKSWPRFNRLQSLPKEIQEAKIELAYIIQDLKFEDPNLIIIDKSSKKHFIALADQLSATFSKPKSPG